MSTIATTEVKEVYTFKGDPDLREALRRVAYAEGTTSSAFVNQLCESNPLVSRELEKIKKNRLKY